MELVKEWAKRHMIEIDLNAQNSVFALFRAGCNPLSLLASLYAYVHVYDDLEREFPDMKDEIRKADQVAARLRKCAKEIQELQPDFSVQFFTIVEEVAAYFGEGLFKALLKWKPSRSMRSAGLHAAVNIVRVATGKPHFSHIEILLQCVRGEFVEEPTGVGTVAHIVAAFDNRNELPMYSVAKIKTQVLQDRRKWETLRKDPGSTKIREYFLK